MSCAPGWRTSSVPSPSRMKSGSPTICRKRAREKSCADCYAPWRAAKKSPKTCPRWRIPRSWTNCGAAREPRHRSRPEHRRQKNANHYPSARGQRNARVQRNARGQRNARVRSGRCQRSKSRGQNGLNRGRANRGATSESAYSRLEPDKTVTMRFSPPLMNIFSRYTTLSPTRTSTTWLPSATVKICGLLPASSG